MSRSEPAITTQAILKIFEVDNPLPGQQAMAKYLSVCSRVEVAFATIEEQEFDSVEKVLSYVNKARNE